MCCRGSEEMEIVLSDDEDTVTSDGASSTVAQDRYKLFITVLCNLAFVTADDLCK